MKEIEITGLKGEFDLCLYDNAGKLKDSRHIKNMTVTAGFAILCAMMGGAGGTAFTYCAIGTGIVAPALGDTTLNAEATRVAGGYTKTADTVWKNDATFGAGVGTGAITEAGLFNATSGPTMLCRQTFPVINKGASDTLIVTWQYTLS